MSQADLEKVQRERLKSSALGIRAHSGWAVVIAVSVEAGGPKILERQRVSVIEPDAMGAVQPYHFATILPLEAAQAHLDRCARAAHLLAPEGLRAISESLRGRGFNPIACVILAASGHPVPTLAKTLASHTMIHTAEGEFFRNAFADACADLGLRTEKIRERDLLDRADKELSLTPAKIKNQLAAIGCEIGPPWTEDQKSAAIAAWLLLGRKKHSRR